ncbi:ABC transporter ATP-binding protein [Haloechinothrix salitolerans]|uniref:ABC transporter ATP-binding protein n=1 Tax=Haloechinothrix salitolerans TaxID=926830 RepID=A0ABW2C7N7_9PSEU
MNQVQENRRTHAQGDPTVRVEALTVQFGDFAALQDLTLSAYPGEVVGVIGPNGAGKSTLVNAMTGMTPPAAGRIEMDGNQLLRQGPASRARRGMIRTFQTAQVFDSLSVERNLMLGRRRPGRRQAANGRSSEREVPVSLRHLLGRRGEQIGGGQRKMTELHRALAAEPRLLLLDEPVAGVPVADRKVVRQLLRQHVDQVGTTVLLIEHDMEFISGICDWLYVMAAGAVISQGPWDFVSNDPVVLEAYLGGF